MKNRISLIGLALIVVAPLAWMNAYGYMIDGGHGIYRINRFTHEVDYGDSRDGWNRIDEASEWPAKQAKKSSLMNEFEAEYAKRN